MAPPGARRGTPDARRVVFKSDEGPRRRQASGLATWAAVGVLGLVMGLLALAAGEPRLFGRLFLGRAKEVVQLEAVTSAEIQRYMGAGDVDGLHAALTDYFWRTARVPGDLAKKVALREALVAKGAGSTYTTAYKLDHDLDQFAYLAREVLNGTRKSRFFEFDVLPRFRRVRARVPALGDLQRTGGLWAFRPEDTAEFGKFYNRALHLPDPPPVAQMLSDGFLNKGGASKAEDAYAAADPAIVVVDDVLSPEGLAQLRDLLLESTVFFETKMPVTFGGYVGAYVEDGLHAKAFLKLADDLRRACPALLGDHPLAYLWAYKYDAHLASGINVHADEAAVNINIWLTDDDANLDPDSGGLVVYTAKPGAAATSEEYNVRGDEYSRALLEATAYANVTVPYKANRAVIFDSALYHKTDAFRFKPGYKNRRINLTLLFGNMSKATPPTITAGEL